ncbi:hypothetical protein PORY_000647 [Pneumocystis oryctolagi]|uniref:Uncharacterized protein n=1 Tax=Pneumocystis oryctolagi TaxID=42067 RepID=A0ACB7CF74_9ASCO|nr:hypothetical protein PORY_000647 [Pneumocystis oryctolagi]
MISFEDSIENQKENIEPLRQGRSVKSLAKAFSKDPCSLRMKNEEERRLFESEIDGSDDLDDPLDVWVKYIKWTNETYPHGQSAESGLVPLLERCIRRFVSDSHYKDDPRYLKVWIQYMKYIDDPRELFCFLAYNGIGQSLSTFYEEYANFLEANGRKSQANEIYQLGIERKARPFDRLQRRYNEFIKRSIESPSMNGSCSPALAPIRSVLSTKFLSTLDSSNIIQSNDEKFLETSRINVYVDSENDERFTKGFKISKWDNIGTIQERRKENYQEAKPWVGEKLPMKKQAFQSVATEKFPVFRDEENKMFKELLTQLKDPPVPKKEEKIMVDLEAIYCKNGEEYSLDELKAKAMNLLGKDWEDDNEGRTVPLYSKNKTPLLEDSFQISSNLKRGQESPTINTKEALADIFDIFNQPLKCDQLDNSSDENGNDVYEDNLVQEQPENTTWSQESPSSDKVYAGTFEENENFNCENLHENENVKIFTQNNEKKRKSLSYDNSITSSHGSISLVSPDKCHSSINLMTPIIEDNEQLLLLNHLASQKKEESLHTKANEQMSSPFQEHVSCDSSHLDFQKNKLSKHSAPFKYESPRKPYVIKEHVCNPFEDNIQKTILSNLNPSINFYDGFYDFSDRMYGKLDLERFNKLLLKKSLLNRELSIKLAENIIYFIKKKLGEGAFAPVYLAETPSKNSNSTSQLRAIKIERSTIPWEFYIIRQIKHRLGLHRALASIINIYEMYVYRDVGFLIMKYRDQGTILDLVNIFKAETGNGIDEVLVIFFTIELLRTLEQLHNKSILHGDLKPDNCLLRFDPVETEWLSKYQRDGSGGWASKGIVIIDFGRGIDLKMFSPQIQFIIDSETDEQDCAEMREARPWTYQIDYHGLATIIHTLLFGKHIEIVPEKSLGIGAARKRYRLVNGFKRYWQQDLWKRLFDLLLNPVINAGEEGLPITKNLKQIREEMEVWLIENCEKGIGLKGMIWKIETLLKEQKGC